jgi:hypothetical protein
VIELSDFAGRWRLVKEITDRRAGTRGRFEGVASFTPDADGLAYLEEGLLHLGGAAPLLSTRRYLWRAAPGGGADAAEVCFEDGRPFHALRFAPRWAAEHHCAPDHYRVHYSFSDWPACRQAGTSQDRVKITRFWQVIAAQAPKSPRRPKEIIAQMRSRAKLSPISRGDV